jgi:hypothetical protein
MTGRARRLAFVGLVLFAVLALWGLASVRIGRAAEADLRDFAQRFLHRGGLRVEQIAHRNHLFGASGTMDLRFADRCGNTGPSNDLLLKVEYSFAFGVQPTGLMRFDWNLHPDGALAGALFRDPSGQQVTLRGQGYVGWLGNVVSSLSVPALDWSMPLVRLQSAPSAGRFELGAQKMALSWNTDRVLLKGGHQALEVRQIAVDVVLDDRERGFGQSTLSIGHIGTSSATVEGLTLASRVAGHDGRLDVVFSPSAQSVTVAGQSLEGLELELALRDVDAQSIERIGRIIDQACDLASLDAGQIDELRGAASRILTEGFSFGVSKLAARVASGGLEGDFMIRVAQGAATSIALADRIAGGGQIRISGEGLTPLQKQLLLASGVAIEAQGGLVSKAEYDGAQIRANGRVLDATFLKAGLRALDERLVAMIMVSPPGVRRTERMPGE